MLQGVENAVAVNVRRDVIGDFFDVFARVAHRDAGADRFQHVDVVAAVAEGDHVVDVVTVFFADFGDADGLSAALQSGIWRIRLSSSSGVI